MKALTLALAASISLTALPSFAHHTVVINGDRGGEIGHYSHQFSYYHHDGAKVRIMGQCLSACTMYLGLPNTCVYPDAILGFHQARDVWGNVSPMGTYEMARHYPWFLGGIAQTMPRAPGITFYSGMDLIRMGARPCM